MRQIKTSDDAYSLEAQGYEPKEVGIVTAAVFKDLIVVSQEIRAQSWSQRRNSQTDFTYTRMPGGGTSHYEIDSQHLPSP